MYKPCIYCIKVSFDPRDPQPCKACIKYCQCTNDLKCHFCIQITGHLLTIMSKICDFWTGYLETYPCYCLDNNIPVYDLKCEDCKIKYCKCNDNDNYDKNKPKCSFCFEKEYNKIIMFAKPEDFLLQ